MPDIKSNDLSHGKLIRLMRIMHEKDEPGYKLTWEGICGGTAKMATQAILAGQFDKFCERLKRISDFVASEKMTELEQAGGFKANFLKRMDTKEEEKQEFIDFKAFFDGVALYQSPERHQEVFEAKSRLNHLSGMPIVYGLIKPSEHNINKIHSFSGCYGYFDFKPYLMALNESFKTSKQDLAVTLTNHNHMILLRYNAKELMWNFLDANHLNKVHISYDMDSMEDRVNLLLNIIKAFDKISNCSSMMIGFATNIYSSTLDHDLVSINDNINNLVAETLNKNINKKEINNYWLLIASSEGHVEIVNALLANNDIDVNSPCNGSTALGVAADRGHTEIIKVLLAKNDIDVNAISSGSTALERAANNGHFEVVKVLLARGADFNGTAIPQLLLKKEISQLFINHLSDCIKKGKIEEVKKFVDYTNFDFVNNPNSNNFTPIYIAASCGQEEIVKLLLEKNPNINTPFNPIDIAIRKVEVEIVTLLLGHTGQPPRKIDYNQIKEWIKLAANKKSMSNDSSVQNKYQSIIDKLNEYNNQHYPTIFFKLPLPLKRKASMLEDDKQKIPEKRKKKS